MTIQQSEYGTGRKIAAVADCANDEVAQKFEFVIPVGMTLTNADILELGVLPSLNTICDATLISDDVGAVTAKIGLMSGAVGSTDVSRTVGGELFAAAATNTVSRMSNAAGFRIAPVEGDRSIGYQPSGNIVGAGQKITLWVYYAQPGN